MCAFTIYSDFEQIKKGIGMNTTKIEPLLVKEWAQKCRAVPEVEAAMVVFEDLASMSLEFSGACIVAMPLTKHGGKVVGNC